MRFAGSKQAIWWGAVALVLVLVLWLLGGAIMPFLLGMSIAYLLDPVVDRLERAGVSRVLAVVLITGLAVLALTTALVWLVPLLIRQSTQLVETTPATTGAMTSTMTKPITPLIDPMTVPTMVPMLAATVVRACCRALSTKPPSGNSCG